MGLIDIGMTELRLVERDMWVSIGNGPVAGTHGSES